MDNKTCPICQKQFSNILEHVVTIHEVMNMEELKKITEEFEKQEINRSEFSKYVDELNSKLEKDEITPQQYRELTSKWWKEHG